MTEDGARNRALRRMVGTARTAAEMRLVTPLRILREALAKSGEEVLALPIRATGGDEVSAPRDALLAEIPEHAFYTLLSDANGVFGLFILDPGFLTAIVEVMTTGAVSTRTVTPRPPTRTDAAILADFLEDVFARFDTPLQGTASAEWATGFRPADFLDKPKTAALILESGRYRQITVDVDLAEGAKTGRVMMILPLERASLGAGASRAAEAQTVWQARLARQIEVMPVPLRAVLWRERRPLAQIGRMAVGDRIEFPAEAVGQVRLEGLDGTMVAEGRLGQAAGMKAVRIGADTAAGGAPPVTHRDVASLPEISVAEDLPAIDGLSDLPDPTLDALGGDELPEIPMDLSALGEET